MAEPITIVSQVSLVLLALVTLTQAATFRDRARRDIAIVFALMSALVLLPGLGALVFDRSIMLDLATMALLAHPYALLRVLRHVSVRDQKAERFLLAAAASAAVAVLVPSIAMGLEMAIITTYLAGAEAWVALTFLRSSQDVVGQLRRRLVFASLGTALFGAAVVIAGLTVMLPAAPPSSATVGHALLAIAGFAYMGAFAPPRWLRRTWHLSSLERFLNDTLRDPATAIEEHLDRIVELSKSALGARDAFVLLSPTGDQQPPYLLHDPQMALPATAPIAALEDRMEASWDESVPMFLSAESMTHAHERGLMECLRAKHLIAVTIRSSRRTWGMLFIVLPHEPLFPEETVKLLEILVRHSALALDDRSSRHQEQRLLNELRSKSDDLERSNGELEAFAYAVSHDLQTPLVAMDWLIEEVVAEASQDQPQAAPLLELSRRIQRNVDGMTQLIHDLLALSRVGREARAYVDVDLDEALAELVLQMEATADHAGMQLVIEHPLPVIRADVRQVTQVFQNLLGNAIKYGAREQGRIEVRAVPTTARDAIQGIRIEVSDNGPGIAPDQRENVFEIFHRTLAATTSNIEGTGIGLALVRKVVHQLGGSVHVDDAPIGGARFVVILPEAAIVEPRLAQPRRSTTYPPGKHASPPTPGSRRPTEKPVAELSAKHRPGPTPE